MPGKVNYGDYQKPSFVVAHRITSHSATYLLLVNLWGDQ